LIQGAWQCPDDYCIAQSASEHGAYYVLYRRGKRDVVFAFFNDDSSATPLKPAPIFSGCVSQQRARSRPRFGVSSGHSNTARSSSPGLEPRDASSLERNKAAVTVSSRTRTTVQSRGPARDRRQQSPVDCQAMFVRQSRSWTFQLPSDYLVDDALSEATEQILESIAGDSDISGISISTLPSTTDTLTVGEWSTRSQNEPPTIIINHQAQAPRAVADPRKMKRLMAEQNEILRSMSSQLESNRSVVKSQALFISNLHDRQVHREMGLKSLQRMEHDVAEVKGHLLLVEDHVSNDVESSAKT